MTLKAKIGVAPIAWLNDDMPELSGDTTLEDCLSDAASIGYSGIELGGKFPRDAKTLSKMLAKHNLTLCSGWYSGTLLTNDIEAEKDRIRAQLELFIDLDAPCIAYGETSGTVQNRRNAPMNTRVRLDDTQIADYGRKLTEFAEWCHDLGMMLGFHHHMGTAIQSHHELDTLMAHSGEAVTLLYDPGHMAFAGGEVMQVISDHVGRISHFHAKDVRRTIINDLDSTSDSFLDAVLNGAFTVPGDGSLDFAAMISSLAHGGYEGWFVVEAEQDPALAPPLEYARIGYTELTRCLISAGYIIEVSPSL